MSEKLLPLFGNLTHGVYVIGVSAMGKKNAFTAAKSVASTRQATCYQIRLSHDLPAA